MKVSIINSGYGNIGSVINMLKKIGVEAVVCEDSKIIKNSSHIILPGVGSFDSGLIKLKESGFYDAIENDVKKFQIPFLGICLGMQFLFRHSAEGVSDGLGLIPGNLERFDLRETRSDLKVPHMGWNYVKFSDSSKLGIGLEKNSRFYFVHSYCYKNTKSILSLIKISTAKSIQVKIDNILEEASKLLNKDKEKIINELSKLLQVVDGDQKVANSVINKIKTNLKI